MYLLSGSQGTPTQGGLWSHCPVSSFKKTEDMISTTQTGAVRCCSIDGASCKSEIPDCLTLTFSKAQQKCSEIGMRLCTEKEMGIPAGLCIHKFPRTLPVRIWMGYDAWFPFDCYLTADSILLKFP